MARRSSAATNFSEPAELPSGPAKPSASATLRSRMSEVPAPSLNHPSDDACALAANPASFVAQKTNSAAPSSGFIMATMSRVWQTVSDALFSLCACPVIPGPSISRPVLSRREDTRTLSTCHDGPEEVDPRRVAPLSRLHQHVPGDPDADRVATEQLTAVNQPLSFAPARVARSGAFC